MQAIPAQTNCIRIDQLDDLIRVACLDESEVLTLAYEREGEVAQVGDVFRARVSRVLPDMQAAFLDIGIERSAFLHRRDLIVNSSSVSKASSVKIEKLLYEGQMLLVQVTKQARGLGQAAKGPTVTAQISLATPSLVYLPNQHETKSSAKRVNEFPKLAFSKKLSASQRNCLRLKLEGALSEFVSKQCMVGEIIVRSEASNNSCFTHDIACLMQQWSEIESAVQEKKQAGCVFRANNIVDQAVLVGTFRNLRLSIDEGIVFNHIVNAAPSLDGVHDDDDQKIMQLVDTAQNQARDVRVSLANGGNISIEPTEAMTVVDVNTGAASRKTDVCHQTNLLAAVEVARQLRLRNLGGIIVIDFINVNDDKNKQELLRVFKDQLDRDPIATACYATSSLGLVEVTRARSRMSIDHYFESAQQL